MKKLIFTLAALCSFFYAKNGMATCSSYTSYTDGQVLTASSLNSLQTNYTNCVNGVLDGDTFTGNMLWYSGADFLVYSDAGSTLKASIDGATGAAILGLTKPGQTTNCGFSVSGTTFTIAGYDGTALSATNPCVVAVKSTTAGSTLLAYFTANVTFTFGAASDTDGNDWGITNSVNWGNNMPFFLGVVTNGTTPYFTISRVESIDTKAAATGLCQKGDTDCDTQSDVMILATGLTLADWVSLPVTQVGWFNIQYVAATTSWTASASAISGTGFNKDYCATKFTMPAGQMGAASGKYMGNNGGNAPAFTTESHYYQICNNVVDGWASLVGDGGSDGSGAVTAILAIPYVQTTNESPAIGAGTSESATGGNRTFIIVGTSADSAATMREYDGTNVQNGDYTNGAREFRAYYRTMVSL